MTIASDYETCLSLAEDAAAAIDAEMTSRYETRATNPLEYATLEKAYENLAEGIRSLRGPGSTNAGPSDQVRTKLQELGL
jgi:hypothetical protein